MNSIFILDCHFQITAAEALWNCNLSEVMQWRRITCGLTAKEDKRMGVIYFKQSIRFFFHFAAGVTHFNTHFVIQHTYITRLQ